MSSNIDPATLTKAVLRAAQRLGLAARLPALLALTGDDLESMSKGERAIDPASREGQLATRFLGLFRSLITLVGTPERAQTWLTEPHQTLNAVPGDLLRSPDGLERVLKYLDAVQKYEIKLPPRSH